MMHYCLSCEDLRWKMICMASTSRPLERIWMVSQTTMASEPTSIPRRHWHQSSILQAGFGNCVWPPSPPLWTLHRQSQESSHWNLETQKFTCILYPKETLTRASPIFLFMPFPVQAILLKKVMERTLSLARRNRRLVLRAQTFPNLILMFSPQF